MEDKKYYDDPSIPSNYLWKVNSPESHRSCQLNELFAALAKAQGEMEEARLDAKNPFFKSKYSSYTELVRASRPALIKHGLSVNGQITPGPENTEILEMILGHSSGQWMVSRMKLRPPKQDIQSLGSYISYLKRYCYALITGVVSNDEFDDDGHAATQAYSSAPKYTAQPSKMDQPSKMEKKTQITNKRITVEQYDILKHEIGDNIEFKEKVIKHYKVAHLDELPKSAFSLVLEKIREINAALKTIRD